MKINISLLCKICIVLQIVLVISCQHFSSKNKYFVKTGFLSNEEVFYLKKNTNCIQILKIDGLALVINTSSIISGYKDSYITIRESWLNCTSDTIVFNPSLTRFIEKLVFTSQNTSFWEDIGNLENEILYPVSPEVWHPIMLLIPPNSCYFQDLYISFSFSGLYRVSYLGNSEDKAGYKYIYIK